MLGEVIDPKNRCKKCLGKKVSEATKILEVNLKRRKNYKYNKYTKQSPCTYSFRKKLIHCFFMCHIHVPQNSQERCCIFQRFWENLVAQNCIFLTLFCLLLLHDVGSRQQRNDGRRKNHFQRRRRPAGLRHILETLNYCHPYPQIYLKKKEKRIKYL